MTNNTVWVDAVNRSIMQNERVHLEYAGTDMDVVTELDRFGDSFHFCDENPDEDGNQVLDIWGHTDDKARDTTAWRLCVTLINPTP